MESARVYNYLSPSRVPKGRNAGFTNFHTMRNYHGETIAHTLETIHSLT